MNPKTILIGLENLAESLGIEVRYERLGDDEFDVRPGRCRFFGRDVILMDRRLDDSARIEILRRELARMNLDGVFIKPYLRDFLETGH